jgi:hypothetical protein
MRAGRQKLLVAVLLGCIATFGCWGQQAYPPSLKTTDWSADGKVVAASAADYDLSGIASKDFVLKIVNQEAAAILYGGTFTLEKGKEMPMLIVFDTKSINSNSYVDLNGETVVIDNTQYPDVYNYVNGVDDSDGYLGDVYDVTMSNWDWYLDLLFWPVTRMTNVSSDMQKLIYYVVIVPFLAPDASSHQKVGALTVLAYTQAYTQGKDDLMSTYLSDPNVWVQLKAAELLVVYRAKKK